MADLNALDNYPYCGHTVLMGKHKAESQDAVEQGEEVANKDGYRLDRQVI